MRDKRKTNKPGCPRSHNTHRKAHNGRPTIAYLAPGIHGTYQSQWSGVVDATQKHNVNLLCVPGVNIRYPKGFWKQSNILYDLITPKNVDGIVSWASALGHYISTDETRTFHEHYCPLPMVTIGKILEGFPGLLMDSYEGMREAIVHLIEAHGYRRLAFIRGTENHFYAQERFRAYTEVLESYGIPLVPNLISPPLQWDRDPAMGMEAMRLLLDERRLRPQIDFEAVVSANDHLLLGALKVLQIRGIHVPEEVAIVGFDDIVSGRTSIPPFTSVRVPFYETGYQAVETVLALIDGQSVPEKTVVPSRLVVRQSCGCLDPAVVKAVAEQVEGTTQAFETAFAIKRKKILEAMRQALEILPKDLAPDWAEHLLDAFATALREKSPDIFLREFDNVLRQVIAAENIPPTSPSNPLRRGSGQDVMVWQNVISTMYCQMLPCFGDQDARALHRAENLWQQARIMIGEAVQRTQVRWEIQAKQQAEILRKIGASLITTFDVGGLMDVLAGELPQLEISRCYLSLYEDPQPYEYPQPAPEWSRLILAYDETGRIALEERFPSRQLVPEGMLPREKRYSLVVMPLYFQENQFGFVMVEAGPQDGNVYEELRGQISSALQGALLMAEITRQKYILDTFMANVPDSIYFKDRDSRITHANRAHALGFGLSDPAEEIGKTDFDFFPEEQARPKYELEQEIIRTGHPTIGLEEPHKNGWVLTTKMPLRNEHGEVIGTFGISRDITKLKQTQEALEQAYAEVEKRVKERTAELQQEIAERKRAEEQIKQHNVLLKQAVQKKQQEMEALFEKLLRQEKLATIGQMAGSIAHELRNPLGAVKQSAFFLKRLYHKQQLRASNPKVKEHLDLIETELNASERVISDLLQMTRMTPPYRKQTDLCPIIVDAVERCHLPEKVQFTIDLHPKPFLMWVDPSQLRQVLINLLTNAVQAIHEKGNITVRAKSLPQDKVSVIEIEDTGIGVEPDAHNKVFEPLYTTKSTGTGLGLSICKQIIERHNGHISIRSEKEQGTIVTIVLPNQE